MFFYVQIVHIMTVKTLSSAFVSNKTTSVTIISFEIINVFVVPYTSCTMFIAFTDNSGQSYRKTVILTGTDYANWASNDDYLTNYINDSLHTIFSA